VANKPGASRKTSAVATATRGKLRRANPSSPQKRKRTTVDATSDATYPSNDENDQDPSDDENHNLEDEEDTPECEQPKRKYPCPFASPRDGARALCKWPPHADKRSVRLCYHTIANN